MIDSMASAHAKEGYAMEFSGLGVAGTRWNPNMSPKEKEEFARKVLSSHHSPRAGWQPFDYYIVKKTDRDRFDKSAEGANIMAPLLKGGSYEYAQDSGSGRNLILKDKNGKIIGKILHGDTGIPTPKELGKLFKMDDLRPYFALGTEKAHNALFDVQQEATIISNFLKIFKKYGKQVQLRGMCGKTTGAY
jgi:hypothetical protein